MQGWPQQEWTLRRIADELNRLNIRLPRGRQWYASSARNRLPQIEVFVAALLTASDRSD
jgi:hypothetical protein